LTDAVAGEMGVEEGAVPLEPLGTPLPVLLPAGKEYEAGVEVDGRELELLAAVTGATGEVDGLAETELGK